MGMDMLPRLHFLFIKTKQNKKNDTPQGAFYEGQEWYVSDPLTTITCLSIVVELDTATI